MKKIENKNKHKHLSHSENEHKNNKNNHEVRRKKESSEKGYETKKKNNSSEKEREIDRKKALKNLEKRKKKELKKKIKQIEKNQIKDQKAQQKKIKRKLSQKEIEKIHRAKRNIKIATIFILIITGLILFILSPVFTIKDVQVYGNNVVSKDQVISLLRLQSNTNLFKETQGNVSKKVKENAYIETVKISRKLPSTLIINIREREAKYAIEFGSSFAYIDNDGNILEIAENNSKQLKTITGYSTENENIKPGNRINDEDLNKVRQISQIIDAAAGYGMQDMFTSINISDEKNYIIYCANEKKTIYFGQNTQVDTKMMYLKAIFEKEKNNEGEIYLNMDLNKKNPYFKQKV